jgi:hypothetical protein
MKKPPYGGFFNEIRPVGRMKSPAAVKSLRGEIPLRGVEDGFHFTVRQSRTISPKATAFDFTAAPPRFHYEDLEALLWPIAS